MSIEKIINEAWDNKDQINPNSNQSIKDAINQVIEDLDCGKSRVAEKINGEWVTHQYLKKAIMLSFRIYPMENLNGHILVGLTKPIYLKVKRRAGLKNNMRLQVLEWFLIVLLEKDPS